MRRACLTLMGVRMNRRNRLEAAVDRLHIKMGSNVCAQGDNLQKPLRRKKQLKNA